MTLLNNLKANLATIGAILVICISFAFWIGTTVAANDVTVKGLSARVLKLETVYSNMQDDVTDIRINVANIAGALNVKAQ